MRNCHNSNFLLYQAILALRFDISWEYDFRGQGSQSGGGKVFVSWDDLKPTYRGRAKKDAELLDLKNIKRFSIMMRRQA